MADLESAFPFPPYDIQLALMRAVTEALEENKVAIIESPTGTGKSLSLICATLFYVQNYENKTKVSNEPEWITMHVAAKRKQEIAQARKDWERAVERVRNRPADHYNRKHIKLAPTIDKQDFLVDYESDSEVSSSTFVDTLDISELDSQFAPLDDKPKIFYCSRTHSQISQFVREIQKTSFAKDVKVVSLGARSNLCINSNVLKLASISRINDKCLDLQQSKDKCPYLSKEPKDIFEFQTSLMASVKDIEEATSLGKSIGHCPYYGTRESVKYAELVTLPYNLMLQKSAREALNINIKDQIVIFDEAHNIADAISSVHTITMKHTQITKCISQLNLYKRKYLNRMSAINQLYIKQLLFVLQNIESYVNYVLSEGKNILQTANDFVNAVNIDNINIYKLQVYLKKSRLAQKLHGFNEAYDAKVGISQNNERAALQLIESFLISLTNSSIDGRIILNIEKQDDGQNILILKYMLLNPADVFSEILNEAKSVILAGGTMSPVDDFKSQLMPDLQDERLLHFSCGHVIPKTSIHTYIINRGPLDQKFEFTFEKRGSAALIDDLGLSILRLCDNIPDGVVVFFPSYSYLEQVFARWKAAKFLDKLEAKKCIFREPKSASDVESTLEKYSAAIDNPKDSRNGAILLSVVSGKLSEGINFSDKLGRGVIMVGMPFANKASLELTEKLAFLQRRTGKTGSAASKEYYENMCMRAVNQSIGRAIRHKADYSVVVLLDHRFSRVVGKLPGWIAEAGVDICKTFGQAYDAIDEFFLSLSKVSLKRT